MTTASNQRSVLSTAGIVLLLLAWDASGLDLPLARLSGGANGFAWQNHWLLTTVLHEGARSLAWLLVVVLCASVWWPQGCLRRIETAERLQLAIGTLLAVFTVGLLKSFSKVSCPVALSDFGGVAHYASHWSHLLIPDGGSGRCFPAGHASAGFAFVGGYFAFRRRAPQIARTWLITSIAAGLGLGIAQQIRGEHFMSHTLWTGLTCWCVCWVVDVLVRERFHGLRALSLEGNP